MKKMFKNTLGFIVALTLSLVLLELYISHTGIVSRSLNTFDDTVGRMRRPNASFIDFNEGFGMGTFNSYGLRGPEYQKEKPVHTLRIALIGDSYIEGFQVFDRQHIRSLLEKNLTEKLQRPVEVLNFGRNGFGLQDFYAYDRLYAQQFHPDITLYFIGNENITGMDGGVALPGIESTGDTINIKNTFTAGDHYKARLFLMQRSSLVQMARNIYQQSRDRCFTYKKIFDKFYRPRPISQENNKQNTVNHDTASYNPLYLSILDALLQSSVLVVDRGYDKLAMPARYDSIIILRTCELFATGGNYDYSYHDWKSTGKNGHWNYEAHEVLAEALAEALLETDMLQQYFNKKNKTDTL